MYAKNDMPVGLRAVAMTTTYRSQIQSIADDRQIRNLLHFTQIANINKIVKHGLVSRRVLMGSDYYAYASDCHRLDENEDAVSISVSQLNEVMFASKQRKSGHKDWVVLVLSADVLWTHHCLFSWRNAATKEIKNHRGWRGGPWAFQKMFEGNNDARTGLADCYPTYSDAEVQVMQSIAPTYIVGAVVNRSEMADIVDEMLNGTLGGHRPVVVEGLLISSRR